MYGGRDGFDFDDIDHIHPKLKTSYNIGLFIPGTNVAIAIYQGGVHGSSNYAKGRKLAEKERKRQADELGKRYDVLDTTQHPKFDHRR